MRFLEVRPAALVLIAIFTFSTKISAAQTCSTFQTVTQSCSPGCTSNQVQEAGAATGPGIYDAISYTLACEVAGTDCQNIQTVVQQDDPYCCSAPSTSCSGSSQCCTGYICDYTNTCQPDSGGGCADEGSACNLNSDCCDGECTYGVCGGGGATGCDECDPYSYCYDYCTCYPNDPSCDPTGPCIDYGTCCSACDPSCAAMPISGTFPVAEARTRTSSLRYSFFGTDFVYRFQPGTVAANTVAPSIN